MKDGLPSSLISYVTQDSQGYLWFGTDHGLSRFDGKKFQLYDDSPIGDDNVLNIFEDRDGKLWICTLWSGLICKDSSCYHVYKQKDGLPHDRVRCIIQGQGGMLWMGTSAGLCTYDGKRFKIYQQSDKLSGKSIPALLIDKNKNLWIGTDKGLNCLLHSAQEEKRAIVKFNQVDILSKEVNALTEDHEGNIWVGTKEGLCCIRKKDGEMVFSYYTVKDGLVNNNVSVISEDREYNIWIGTENGISRFSLGKFFNYNVKSGFLHPKIFTIFEDKEGNIWFGTRMGASCLQSLKILNFTKKEGLPGDTIWAIMEETPGKIWVGTDEGLSCYSGGKFQNYTAANGLISNQISNLFKDRAGNLWIATYKGLSIFSPQTGKFRNYTEKDGLPSEIVLSLAEGQNGTIWIGTHRGLCRYANGRILPHNMNIDLDVPINVLLLDRNGNLWISVHKGFWKISGEKKIFYSKKDGLLGEVFYSIFEDSKGNIWMGSKEGLSCWNHKTFKNFTKADGLSDNNCLFILEDNNHLLWIGAQNGVNRYDGRHFKKYTSKNGLVSEEMNQAGIKDSNGMLWFATNGGLTCFNPKLDRPNEIPPPVYMTLFSVNEKDCLSVVGSGLKQKKIVLKHDENYIKFGFIGLSYTSPEDVKYEYQLSEGTNKKISETSENYIPYPLLPPGDYTFKVWAKNNDGVRSKNPAVISFRINFPFYQTPWFLSFMVLLITFMIIGAIMFQNKRLKEKLANEAKNKQLVMAQRMKLMGVLAGGAVHDLKNLLSIIIGYSELVHDSSTEVTEEEKNEAIDIIKCTADTAFQVVSQILAFARQNFDEVKIVELSDLLNEILAILKVTIPRTIELIWNPPSEKLLISISAVKFKQVVMNLCLNAVQAMGKYGELKITLKRDPAIPSQLYIEVADTGAGIKPEHLEKIFDPLFTTKGEEKGTGLGLFVVKQVVEEYKGKIQVQSVLAKGTTFKIYFPCLESNEETKN
ncbi:MAG: two-component regulator propeller domain-containing protein [Candidatus Omnitrophota bacterium]